MRTVALTTPYTTLAEINMPEDWYLVSDGMGNVSIRTPTGDIDIKLHIILEPDWKLGGDILNQMHMESYVYIDHNDRREPE